MAEFKTDIEIAQSTEMLPITEIAKTAGIDDKYLEQYGKYKAKVDYGILRDIEKPDGKLVLVTAGRRGQDDHDCRSCGCHEKDREERDRRAP